MRAGSVARGVGRRLLPGLALSLAALAGCPEQKPRPVQQPLAFSHAVHVGKRQFHCTLCHMGAEREPRAGLPSLSQCLSCHMKPQGDPPSEAEQRVRKLAADGTRVRWIQVTRNPGHVYFSHRAHVALGGMSCFDCHEDVTQWAAPPERPSAALNDMEACMDCHRKRGASNGCRTCHR
jgi:hypothetical protein